MAAALSIVSCRRALSLEASPNLQPAPGRVKEMARMPEVTNVLLCSFVAVNAREPNAVTT